MNWQGKSGLLRWGRRWLSTFRFTTLFSYLLEMIVAVLFLGSLASGLAGFLPTGELLGTAGFGRLIVSHSHGEKETSMVCDVWKCVRFQK